MTKGKLGVPQVRSRLRELAAEHGIKELDQLADALYRDPPITRAAKTSAEMTPELAEQIRDYVATHPELHQRHVAEKFNVNPGRVSDSLKGRF